MRGGFETFDHTADLGLRIWAPTLAELAEQGVTALYAAIGEVVVESGNVEDARIEIGGANAAELLRDLLARFLEIFETRERIAVELTVDDFSDRRIVARAVLARVDADRTVWEREVKAITYHDLAVRRTRDGWEAKIIVDI